MPGWSGVSPTCPQQVLRVRLVEFRERHDKRAALPQPTAVRKCNKEVANFLVTCYEEVSDKLRTYYEEVTRKLLPWNLRFRSSLVDSSLSFNPSEFL